MQLRVWMLGAVVLGLGAEQVGGAQVGKGRAAADCSKAVFEGDVKAGEGFEKVFAKGLKFYLEPLRSGWIVRVLAADRPREAHDYAGLVSPPYNSVSPLLVSTDWSFRAQDAVAWNPRRFRYAGSEADFRRLEGWYSGVVAGDSMKKATATSQGRSRLLATEWPGVLAGAMVAASGGVIER